MVSPLINTPQGAVSVVQPVHEQNQDALHLRPSNGNDPGWFLPQGSSSLQSISATADPSLQGASPDGVASRVLSHIGA